MRKYLKEKPKQKTTTNQNNKLKKVLYPSKPKLITLENNQGENNQKFYKKRQNISGKKIKNNTISPTLRKEPKSKNSKNINLTNKSQNNNTFLELDYLNFSKIDLGLRKINSSFDDDIFGSKIFKEDKNNIVSNRYNEIDSSFDTIKNDTNNNNYIEESKENLLKTPSTLCNYYDKSEAASSTKKVNHDKNNNNQNELRKNLDNLYGKNKNNVKNEIKYINVNTKLQNAVNWRVKDSIKITKNKSSNISLKEKDNKEKEFSKTLNQNNQKEINKIIYDIKQNNSKQKSIQKDNNININNQMNYKNKLMENYLNSNIKKRNSSFNMSSSKKK